MSPGRVVVVGGGPAGAAVAWRLASAGVEVTLLDRARFPRDKACAEYLSPAATRLLAEMGALAPIAEAGAAYLEGMTVRAPGGALIRGSFANAPAPPDLRVRAGPGARSRSGAWKRLSPGDGSALGLAIRRTRLDSILLDRARAAGAEVREGVRVTALRTDAGGVVTGVDALMDGAARAYAADLVVGADGLRSIVARRLGLQRAPGWPRRIALVAHFRGVAGIGAYGEMHVERDGYCGMADVGLGESNLSLVVPAWRAREMAGGAAAFLEGWIATHPQLAARYRGAERLGAVLATGPFASRARRAWAPGAVLVGDAASYFDPFTGEGIHAALRGAELLAPHALDALAALRDGSLAPSSRRRRAAGALRAYGRARWREFGGSWGVERVIAAVVAHPALMDRAARSLSTRPELADTLVRVTGGLLPARAVLEMGYLYDVFVGAGRLAAHAPPPRLHDPGR